MKTPYKALDLPPRLTTTEWVWFFEYVTQHATAELRTSVASESQMDKEIGILGHPIPYKGVMEIDPDEARERAARLRASYQRIIDMAVYLLRQAEATSVEKFGKEMADYFNQKGGK